MTQSTRRTLLQTGVALAAAQALPTAGRAQAQTPGAEPRFEPQVGGWRSFEGNWVGWNTAHDVRLPGSGAGSSLPFLMYPQGRDARGRFDELAPESFRYSIAARELTA